MTHKRKKMPHPKAPPLINLVKAWKGDRLQKVRELGHEAVQGQFESGLEEVYPGLVVRFKVAMEGYEETRQACMETKPDWPDVKIFMHHWQKVQKARPRPTTKAERRQRHEPRAVAIAFAAWMMDEKRL